MTLWPESVRWRLTLWYAAVLAVPLILFAVGSRYLVSNVLLNRADWFLQEARASFMAELSVELGELSPARAVRAATRDVRFRDIRFVVFDARDSLLGASEGPDTALHEPVSGPPLPEFNRAELLALRVRGRRAPVPTSLMRSDTSLRVVIGPVTYRGKEFTVAAVQSRETIRTTLSRVTLAYLIAIPLFLLVATIGGHVLARGALAPVAMMSRQAREIGATNLHERLPVPGPPDELRELATMVNELLERLETSFEQQRRFVANASHELRTPVAIVRAESEIALGREGRHESEYRDSLLVVRDAADRMSRIVHDLFLLARADAGHMPMQTEPLYLDEMVADVARSMRAIASQSEVRIDVAPMTELPLVGDVELLARMLTNLLVNAVKFSRPGSSVRVHAERANGSYRLAVADDGVGIPADAQAHVFERFFRADKSRAQVDGTATSGAGLGLAIVKLIAEAHGGRAELTRSSAAGSEFTVVLPAQG
jgi:heavy metal sensor kinase